MADTDQGKRLSHGEVSEGAMDSPAEDDRRPTPVRMAMEGGDDEEKGRSGTHRAVHHEGTGVDWVVAVSGRSASGILPLRTIFLMELTFATAEKPGQPLRRVLHPGNDLTDLSDHELLSLFEQSGPYREPMKVRAEKDGRGGKGKSRRPPRP